MPVFEFTSSGELKIIASNNSSQNDFDFLVGHHLVHHKKLKTRLNNCKEWVEFDGTHEMRKQLNGISNVENHYMTTTDGKPFEGMALRLFNPATKLWNILWADSDHGALDIPVVGSFENNIGHFFAKDIYEAKPIILQFQWDAINPDKPVWSQAFSADDGKTWEWNWYMYFSKDDTDVRVTRQDRDTVRLKSNQEINVIELRNYVLKPGARDRFIDFFERNFIHAQIVKGGFPLGQYRIKGADDNFFWIRGFENMASRSKFLPEFYYGPIWKEYGPTANKMLANNDNVHLLKPLTWDNGILQQGKPVSSYTLKSDKGIAVVDFYIANSKLDKLIPFFSANYLPLLKSSGIDNYTLWVSELTENDFPRLPVFQDKNLLVMITFYRDELEYQEKQKQIGEAMKEETKAAFQDIITIKNSLILYPTEKSHSL